MKFVKFFQEIAKNDVDVAGGKGASLGEMTMVGIPVPEGFVVLANAFNYFLAKEGLIAEVEAELGKINFEDTNSVEETSERLRGLIEKVAIPLEIIDEIEKSYFVLSKSYKLKANSSYVAVRSSATAEDSSVASWAGELESYLYTSHDRLINNIKKCWSSLFTPRALFYRHEKGLLKDQVAVAVVVQRMVNSSVSGITFTVHPVTKNSNQMIIEAAWGLGEAIVGGMITPDDYVVRKLKTKNLKLKTKVEIIDILVNKQEKMIVPKKGGGTEEVTAPRQVRDRQKLTQEQILEIAQICQKIENHYGCPQDIEWAMEKTESYKLKAKSYNFYILQSRPITTL